MCVGQKDFAIGRGWQGGKDGGGGGNLEADCAVFNDKALSRVKLEALRCNPIDRRVWLLIGDVVPRHEDVQALHSHTNPRSNTDWKFARLLHCLSVSVSEKFMLF